MKTKNLFMLLALAGMMIFASCKKDETPAPLTLEEAEIALGEVDGAYSGEKDAFMNSDGNMAMDAIDNLGLPFTSGGGISKAPRSKESFQQSILKDYKPNSFSKADGPFFDLSFTENVGTWHKVDGIWTKTSPTPNNKIVVIFSFNGGTDNGTLTYFNYAEKTISFGVESETYMSALSCTVDIVGKTNPVASWNFSANMSVASTSVKASMRFDFNLGIYSMVQAFAVEETMAGGAISMLEEIRKNGEVLRAASFLMKIANSVTGFNMLVEAKFRIKDLVIVYALNIDEGTDFYGDPSLYQTVYVKTAGGALIAEVIYKYEMQEWVPYFRFADGTEALITDYLNEELFGEIDDFGNMLNDLGFKN